eukprot:8496472-Prorocentrum_lima.AAC.1
MTSSLVGSEMCIRDSPLSLQFSSCGQWDMHVHGIKSNLGIFEGAVTTSCLLYTSDAADDM